MIRHRVKAIFLQEDSCGSRRPSELFLELLMIMVARVGKRRRRVVDMAWRSYERVASLDIVCMRIYSGVLNWGSVSNAAAAHMSPLSVIRLRILEGVEGKVWR